MEKDKKTVTIKTLIIRRIIFIVIFTIIASLVTTYFIFENNKKTPKQNEIANTNKIEEPKRNHVGLINFDNDTFNYNNLKIDKIDETFEDYDITYFQIDGLKNTEIQDRINRSLNYDLKTKITEAKEAGKIQGNFYIYSDVSSCFENTISIIYFLNSYIYDENINDYTYEWNEYITENYDLRTGKKIQIQDLFTDDCLGSDIFTNKFYNELVSSSTKTELDEENFTIKVTDYDDIEEKMLKIIIDFNEGKDIPFYFDEQKVILAKSSSRIFFDDVLEFVAVYNNFKSEENIFNGKYEALENVPVLTKRFPYSYHQVVEESENYYIDFTLSSLCYIDNKDSKIKDNLLKSASNYLDNDVSRIKEEIKNNSNFSIFNYGYNVSDDYDNKNLYVLSITKAEKKISKTFYDNEFKQKIQDVYRKAPRIEGGDIYLDTNLFYSYTLSENEHSIQDGGWIYDFAEIYMDEQGNIYPSKEEALRAITPWGTND